MPEMRREPGFGPFVAFDWVRRLSEIKGCVHNVRALVWGSGPERPSRSDGPDCVWKCPSSNPASVCCALISPLAPCVHCSVCAALLLSLSSPRPPPGTLSLSLSLSHLSPLSHSRPGPSMLKKHSDLRTPTRFTEFIFKCVSYDHERDGVSTL